MAVGPSVTMASCLAGVNDGSITSVTASSVGDWQPTNIINRRGLWRMAQVDARPRVARRAAGAEVDAERGRGDDHGGDGERPREVPRLRAARRRSGDEHAR